MDGTAPSTNGISAAYGHSCANCVRAKCRCVIRDGGSCERCHRLRKECTPATTVRKRGVKRAAPVRRAQLEDKLDDLVSLLQAQQSGKVAIPAIDATHTAAQPTPSNNGASHKAVASETTVSTPSTCISTSYLVPPPVSVTPDKDVSMEGFASDLHVFRTRFLNSFPFIHLPSTLSAEQLLHEKPFLCLTIRNICAKSYTRQIELSTKVREALALRAVAHGERSLDLLLSLIACMSWSLYFTHGRAFLGMMSQVGRSLLFDLRLDRPINVVMGCPKMGPALDFEPSGMRTNEERRALISSFVLSAMVCTSLKYDSMKWSPQLEEACAKLSEADETSNDGILIAIARISRVALEAADMTRRASEDPEYARHTIFQIKLLQTSIEHVKYSIPREQLQHNTVLSYLYSTEVLIHEAALYQPTSTPLNDALGFTRIDCLSSCLQATKSCMDNFISASQIHMSMAPMLSFSHSLQVLYKLSVLKDPAWDRATVRAMADAIYYLEQTTARSQEASVTLQLETGEESVFSKAAEVLKLIIPVWRAALEEESVPPADMAIGSELTDNSLMDFSEEIWSDMFVPWNF